MPFGSSLWKMATLFWKTQVLVILISCLCATDGANILGIFPMPVKSHMIVHSALMKDLARIGHQVTVFSPFPDKYPIQNFTDIEFKLSYSDLLQNSGTSDMLKMTRSSFFQKIQFSWDLGIRLCEILIQHKDLQSIINSKKEEFDVIITSAFFNDCVFGIRYMLDIPVIKMCSFGGSKWMDEWVGNPSPYAYLPQIFSDLGDRMTFWQRTVNTLSELYMKLGRIFYVIPQHDAILRKYFNSSNIPSVSVLEKSTALLLINQHFSIGYPRPLMPNTVEIGGIHINPPEKLNADLQKFIDESPDGVIYFSMGSVLHSSNMKNATTKAFLESFSKMKQRVLWKWETDSLPGQPSNVKLFKWIPQSDILAHPNVRLFITHGGLLSTQEAIHRGVPLVGIPVYGDQYYNLARIVSFGIGIRLDYGNITTESVTWALNEVLNNQSYRENAQRLSRIYRDQPLTPLDQAVYWTEYVIRHKGAPHLRSAVLDLTWYQYFLLDVIAVLALVALCVLMALYCMSRAVISRLFDTMRILTSSAVKKND